ncbi:hypothetical protein [Guptibacillus spartinae]|uniref:hypothetical protein n=1 Tax=Guptibacillus spartinae TaxID=3025679 RepID=UPI002361DC44|nr:hypothetical protein [Pseudalkalibacillus spartinae]
MDKLWLVGRIVTRIYIFITIWLIGTITVFLEKTTLVNTAFVLILGYSLGVIANSYLKKMQLLKRSGILIYMYSYLIFLTAWFIYANDYGGRTAEITSTYIIGMTVVGLLSLVVNRFLKGLGLMNNSISLKYIASGDEHKLALLSKNIRKGTIILLTITFIFGMTEISPTPSYSIIWTLVALVFLIFGLKLYRNFVYKRYRTHTNLKLRGQSYNQRYIDLYKERSELWSGWLGDEEQNSNSNNIDAFPEEFEKPQWQIDLEKVEELEHQSFKMRTWGQKGVYDVELDEIDNELGRTEYQRELEDEKYEYERETER